MNAFGRELPEESDLKVASESEKGVAEGDSIKSRDFLIIFRKESILLLCLAWIEATAIVTVDAIALVIDCWREKSMILELAVISSNCGTALGNLSVSMSQKGL